MTMWMARGDAGRLYEEFRERGVAAIGWAELIDAKPGMSREQLIAKYAAAHPDFKRGHIISGASQVWRFINEMQVGDHVITYNPSTRKYLVGTIEGPFTTDSTLVRLGMALQRRTKWLGEVSRDDLSTKTKNSLGSTLTLFVAPDFAETEVLAALRGERRVDAGKVDDQIEDEASIDTDRDARDLLGDVEARALEFIKDKLTELDWDEMQELTAGILRAMGYKTRVARPGPDRGADIVASPDGLGFEMPRIVVEVKHRQGQMGAKEVRSFLGGRHKDDRGLFVSTGGFSKDARYEADRASIPLALWDLDDLFDTLSRTTKHSMLR